MKGKGERDQVLMELLNKIIFIAVNIHLSSSRSIYLLKGVDDRINRRCVLYIYWLVGLRWLNTTDTTTTENQKDFVTLTMGNSPKTNKTTGLVGVIFSFFKKVLHTAHTQHTWSS